jgi:3-oxoadipate enol-lactonase
MPTFSLNDGNEMHYKVDDYTDPWAKPETILMLHGNAESGAVWFGWVPHLARRFRVVRPDLRGFGQSTPMPEDFPWTLDGIIDDYVALMDALGVDNFHLVGAKIGGTVARRFAARCPGRVTTLTLVGTPPPNRKNASLDPTEWVKYFEKEGGVEAWARDTMQKRLGSAFPKAGIEWWIGHMAKTARLSELGFMRHFIKWDISADMAKILCPTLVMTTQGSALGSTEETEAWQQTIARSRLLVLPGDSYHVAASDADRCAEETLAFIAAGHKAL